MTESGAYTEEEARALFLDQVEGIVRFWSTVDTPCDDRVDGVVFSILSLIDGVAVGSPGFRVTPDPHPNDRAYHEERGERWWSPDTEITNVYLHDEWTARKRRLGD
jgi:hypothetical protein